MKKHLRFFLYLTAGLLIITIWNKWQFVNQPQISEEQIKAEQQINQNALIADENDPKIRVKTDVLDFYISKRGATVVKADLLNYKNSLKDQRPFALIHQDNPQRMVLTSGIIAKGLENSPNHIANWESEKNFYELKAGEDSLTVPFVWQENGVKVVKTFKFQRGSYEFELNHQFENNSDKNLEAFAYSQISFGAPQGRGGLSNMATFTGAAISSPDKRYEKIDLSDIRKIKPTDTPESNKYKKDIATNEGWVAMIQHYFLASLIPTNQETHNLYTNYNYNNGDHIVGIKSNLKTIKAGQRAEFSAKSYVGPKIVKDLANTAPYLDKAVDYGWLFFISEFMFKVMELVYKILGNWGWAIVIITLMIKGAFFVPSAWAYKSMAKMRALQPELLKMKERFGDDKQAMAQEQMMLFKREGVNPMSGCLPMLLQIPFFIAFYYMLAESVELRQSAWIFWIKDLSVMDPYFILPIINAALMFLQQKLNPPPTDPVQAKVMMMLPLIFGFMFMWFPSGLVLYWTVSNAFGIVQQYVMNKKYSHLATAKPKSVPQAAND